MRRWKKLKIKIEYKNKFLIVFIESNQTNNGKNEKINN